MRSPHCAQAAPGYLRLLPPSWGGPRGERHAHCRQPLLLHGLLRRSLPAQPEDGLVRFLDHRLHPTRRPRSAPGSSSGRTPPSLPPRAHPRHRHPGPPQCALNPTRARVAPCRSLRRGGHRQGRICHVPGGVRPAATRCNDATVDKPRRGSGVLRAHCCALTVGRHRHRTESPRRPRRRTSRSHLRSTSRSTTA
jgi:hypothetical protein